MIVELQAGEMVVCKYKLHVSSGWRETYNFVTRQWMDCYTFGFEPNMLAFPLFFTHYLQDQTLANPVEILKELEASTAEATMCFYYATSHTIGALRKIAV